MASPEPSSRPLSLLALPPEIHAAILPLRFFDLHTLRLVNKYFYALIPPPIHAELLLAETLDFDFLACVGCTRLRPVATFSSKMFIKKKAPGGTQAHNRFCIECGHRPLPGTHRYMLGSRWKEDGVPFARCKRCTMIAKGPEDQAVPLCFSCHTQDLERARAVEELKRVQMEARGREERTSLRAERRRCWVDRGFALSDFSSEDSSEQDDRDYHLGWGQDDDMNYSAPS
jgi:hypothetical protein